ncbi:MAG: hypothetical protein OEO20_07930 [Gemmatimonadota bacterium]|nr:hypothetical protein [Gemmatimonadota bacterium]MDH3478218.1 hypothetical protein [Gemmatimonadota bacterium]MDH3568681.1 hypothetical protein [Gemmatimonadota bacterium]MDH5549015.1 hypothetical protein [Gemmatimonadota bacterium]
MHVRTPVLAGSLALLLFAGCGDDVVGVSQDLSGTYTLVSFALGTPAGVVQGATGAVTLTATTYVASFTVPQIPPAPPEVVDDEGTYTAIGSATSGTWTQQSTLDPNLQYAGTFTFDSATERLTLDTTTFGVRTILVLQRN